MTREDAIKTLKELWRETNDPWYEEVYNMAIDALEADRKTEQTEQMGDAKPIPLSSRITQTEPQTYITEDRDTQILDAWQVHHRSTTSVEDEPQTERSE